MISIIVPVYNLRECILRALDSILGQTYADLEVIVVNDGSTDGSAEMLDSYAAVHPEKVRVIHKENGGVTSARLVGVCAAQGEWIGFMDGDDTIDPDMYERLLDNAQKYGADISHCGYQMNFSEGRVHYFHNSGRLMERSTADGLRDLLDGTIVEPGLWNKLYKKELLVKMLHSGNMLADVKINEDLLMNFILFGYAHKSIFEDFCPYHYIVRQGSASRQKLNANIIHDPVRVKEHILTLAPDEVVPVARRAYLATCINVYGSVTLSGQPELEADRTIIRENLLAHYEWTKLLSKKQRLLAALIRYAPWMYKPLYGFYATYILKNPYE